MYRFISEPATVLSETKGEAPRALAPPRLRFKQAYLFFRPDFEPSSELFDDSERDELPLELLLELLLEPLSELLLELPPEPPPELAVGLAERLFGVHF